MNECLHCGKPFPAVHQLAKRFCYGTDCRVRYWRMRNQKQMKAASIQNYKQNRERCLSYAKMWKKQNPERYRQLDTAYDRRARLRLGDTYIKRLLSKSIHGPFPDWLVSLQREFLKLKRLKYGRPYEEKKPRSIR
jgi:hypothetical protein